MRIVNYTEAIIDKNIPIVQSKYPSFCGCEICLLDTKAYALNNLKPMYFITQNKGQLYTRMAEASEPLRQEIQEVLSRAIEIITSNPRHK